MQAPYTCIIATSVTHITGFKLQQPTIFTSTIVPARELADKRVSFPQIRKHLHLRIDRGYFTVSATQDTLQASPRGLPQIDRQPRLPHDGHNFAHHRVPQRLQLPNMSSRAWRRCDAFRRPQEHHRQTPRARFTAPFDRHRSHTPHSQDVSAAPLPEVRGHAGSSSTNSSATTRMHQNERSMPSRSR